MRTIIAACLLSLLSAAAAAQVSATITVTDALCFGESNGRIELSTSGGTAPYTYTWTVPPTAPAPTNTNDLQNIPAGSYDVTIIDNLGLTQSYTGIVVLEPTAITTFISDNNPLICGQFGGEVEVFPTGGTGPYTYLWEILSGGLPFNNNLSDKAQTQLAVDAFSNIGNYRVTVTDNNGCTAVDSTLLGFDNFFMDIYATYRSCDSSYCLEVAPVGQSAFFEWDNFTFQGNPYCIPNSGFAPGMVNHSVEVGDPYGCRWIGSKTFNFNPAPLSVSIAPTASFCGASLLDLQATAQDGDPFYLYRWNTGAGGRTLNGVTQGLYAVTTTDANGCTAASAYSITAPNNPATNQFIDLRPLATVPATFRPGRPTNFIVNAINEGCQSSPATLCLVYDTSKLGYTSSSTAPDRIVGDTLQWDVASISYVLANPPINVEFSAKSTLMIGDDVTYQFFVKPENGEVDTINNYLEMNSRLINSYDPNDIQVSPSVCSPTNYFTPNDKLTYTIRYQNTGNASAIDIFVLDTIDPNLDLYSLQLQAAKHSSVLNMEVINNSVIKFDFPNIFLPDSASDPEGSQGYIVFDILPKTGITLGSVIENRVGIYFDFNPPIITNTVRSTIVNTLPQTDFTASIQSPTPIQFGGQTLNQSGTYTGEFTASDGCDSVVTLLFSLSSSSSNSFTQLGQDIDGEAPDDESGTAVSLSYLGNRVAIGAIENDAGGNNAGQARVYEWNGTTWVQLGLDINGAVEDRFGEAIELSADGNTVAVGSQFNDDNGNNAGHVRVYQWNGSAWVQKGADIQGESADNGAGQAISISADGNRIAVGAHLNDVVGMNAGHVRVFDWNGTAWVQAGITLLAEAANDRFGFAVSLSDNGDRLAVGAYRNGVNGPLTGHVRVYEWTGTSWAQLGIDIDGAAQFDNFGTVLELSADGNEMIVGIPGADSSGIGLGAAEVYQWTGTTWLQMGATLYGEASGDLFGNDVSITDNGELIAIGAERNDDGGSQAGHTRLFRWNGSAWVQLGQDIDGEAGADNSGKAISLSGFGNRVAIGAARNDGPSVGGAQAYGHVRVYQLQCALSTITTIDTSICAGTSYAGYAVAGTYSDTLTAISGCDSIVTINLTVLDTSLVIDTTTICDGDSYFGYTLTGVYDFTLQGANGCDSTYRIDLTVLDSSLTYIAPVSICTGDNYMGLTQPGINYLPLTKTNGCDSTLVVDLTVLDSSLNFIRQSICQGDNYLGFTLPGLYFVPTANNAAGCDSTLRIDLTVLDTSSTMLQPSICTGDDFAGFTQTGIYTLNLMNNNGCDSTVIIDLTVRDTSLTLLQNTICEGDTFLGYTQTGMYTQNLSKQNGCDSTVLIDVTVLDTSATTLSQSICDGDSYLGYTQAGVYTQNLTNTNGCDSTVVINLSVLTTSSIQLSDTICQGSSSLGYSQTGQYVDTLVGDNGCDSIRTFNLLVLRSDSTNELVTICQGDSYLGFDSTGIYTLTYTNAISCDSVHTIDLSVLALNITTATREICEGDSTQINGQQVTVAGIYYDTLVATANCPLEILEFTVTVNSVANTTIDTSIAIGDSLLAGGALQTTTGTYYDTLVTGNGCDSIVTTNAMFVPVSIDELTSDQINIYPNPTADELTVEWSGVEATLPITIYNQLGQVVLSESISIGKNSLDVSGLAAGVYVLRSGEFVQRVAVR